MTWKTPRVPLRDIRQDGIEIVADQSTPWVRELLHEAAPPHLGGDSERWNWVDGSTLAINLKLSRMPSGSDFLLEGRLDGRVPGMCGRCGDDFSSERSAQLRLFLHQALATREEEQADYDDLEYREFSSQYVDLIDILAEQMVLAEPMVDCPKKDQSGACLLCHRNPETGVRKTGQVTENKADSPFAILEKSRRS